MIKKLTPKNIVRTSSVTLRHYNEHAESFVEHAGSHSGCEVWQQGFLKLDLPLEYFDGVFANASLFHVPSQELPRVLGARREFGIGFFSQASRLMPHAYFVSLMPVALPYIALPYN